MAQLIPVVAVRDAVHFPGLVNTLQVVRAASVRAMHKAADGAQRVVVLSQRDMSVESPIPSDLSAVGILSETLQVVPMPDTSLRVALKGIRRVHAKRIVERRGCFYAQIEDLVEEPADGEQVEALARAAIASFTKVVEGNLDIPPECLDTVVHYKSAGDLADSILHHLPLRSSEKQELLEELHQERRLYATVRILQREERIIGLRSRIESEVDQQVAIAQREYFLKEQLRIIQRELGQSDGGYSELDQYETQLEGKALPAAVEQRVRAELVRLQVSPLGPEAVIIRNYVETLLDLPWQDSTADRLDLDDAKRVLDARHYGLDSVKERILDYLAVRKLRGDAAGSILCFVGPPGVGKTSLGKSIAEAMGRKFASISLGGVRDEAELRGHRRAYVGSNPGRILQAIRQCGSRNPVIVLDEVDKLGQSPSGDPMSVLLEALDPDQRRAFSDHYVELPFDLSETIFIGTANLLDPIPPAVRDRMDILQFPAYTQDERFSIAAGFLLPDALAEAGLRPDRLEVSDDALAALVTRYTREAGVRNVGRLLGRICQKAARTVASQTAERVSVGMPELEEMLGPARPASLTTGAKAPPGLAYGLVVSEMGGGVIAVEASLLPPLGERPDFRLTGHLGHVMQESAMAAHTYLLSRLSEPLHRDVHIHIAEGAIPKEGPSAGLTVLLALASAQSGRRIRSNLATTGEITLSGRVMEVGGVRDKLLAAVAHGITEAILPAGNEQDYRELPASDREKLHVHFVDCASEALEIAFGPG